jgi:hypothetical protein
MQLRVVFEGESLPEPFKEALHQAQSNIKDLEVQVFSAPSGLTYTVPTPIVRFEGNRDLNKEYGDDGLSLIRAVAAGQFQ